MIAAELEKTIKQLNSPLILKRNKVSEDTYIFELAGKKNNWNISLWFREEFPYFLPSAKLLDTAFIGTIPHVNKAGTICIEESDTVLLDYERPRDIIEAYLKDAVKLLERAKLKIYQDELFDEYEGYFGLTQKVNSFYYAQDKLERISMRIVYKEGKNQQNYAIPILLYGRHQMPPKEFSNINMLSSLQEISIIHLPLNQPVFPPSNTGSITAEYIEKIKKNITKSNQHKLQKLLEKKQDKKQFFILISMPRTMGERSQLLLQFTAQNSLNHPLATFNNEWDITPYLINRHNKEYLLERGGANNSLENYKVAVIGCGSIGSEITSMIAKAGVGELTLIDKDGLEADNIYRHQLGGSYLNFMPNKKTGTVKGNYKVNALATELNNALPYIKLNRKTVNFKEVISDADFLKSDVVIVAVGSPTVSLQINKKLKELGLNKVIFCWNEAAGYGGHSLALDLTQNCLECIYTSDDGFTIESHISLLKIGQNISKNLTGCAGVFTPFSNLDSIQTASLATKQCINLLVNNIHSQALSWKGDHSQNLKVTDRYLNMPLKEELPLGLHSNCRVCNG